MVTIFVIVQVVNNLAFKFDVPMPLHMIFRAVSTCVMQIRISLNVLNSRYSIVG